MRSIICSLGLAVIAALGLAACDRSESTAGTSGGGKADMETKLSVPEMHCSSCVGTIRGGLREVPGVEGSAFDLSAREVTIRWDSKKTDLPSIEAALTKAGFTVAKPTAPKP